MKYEEKGNNELMQILNNLKIEHDAIKTQMLKDLDRLEQVEATFEKINKILKNRLSGQ